MSIHKKTEYTVYMLGQILEKRQKKIKLNCTILAPPPPRLPLQPSCVCFLTDLKKIFVCSCSSSRTEL